MSTCSRKSSIRKWRKFAFLHSGRSSPPLPESKQISLLSKLKGPVKDPHCSYRAVRFSRWSCVDSFVFPVAHGVTLFGFRPTAQFVLCHVHSRTSRWSCVVRFVFPVGHGMTELASGRLLNLCYAAFLHEPDLPREKNTARCAQILQVTRLKALARMGTSVMEL